MADAVETLHPDYSERITEWQMMRRTFRGPMAVKKENYTYLPMPDGYRAQADGGLAYYTSYQMRAQFPDIVKPSITGMVGIIHRNEAQIELPEALKPLEERATLDGLPLEAFHQKITTEILIQGRYGILTDVPQEGGDVPYLAGYATETLINWAEDATMFVLDESAKVRNGFVWRDRKRYRVLELVNDQYQIVIYENGERQNPVQAQARAAQPMTEIPFVVVGGTEVVIKPQDPPLRGLAEAALALYRLDADYRNALYMSGQETLFIIGLPKKEDMPPYVGSGVVIGLPAGADAKYVGIAGNGIGAVRQAMVDERDNAMNAAAKMFEGGPKGAEAAEALRIRLAAQTATLSTVSNASAAALEKALRHAATFVGADPNSVVVKPNKKLVDTALAPSEAKALMELWMGQAISYETLYENLQRGEIASPERTAEEEQAKIEVEAPDLPAPELEPGASEDEEIAQGAA